MCRKYIMYPHGGSGNHGCEAIVRTTISLLGEDNDFLLFSDGIEEDRSYIENQKFSLESPQKDIRRMSPEYLKAFIQYHVQKQKDAYDVLHFSPIIKKCVQENILLSIGGDNYCYGDNGHIYLVNRYARRQGCKTVLWGCSVEPDDITPTMLEDIKEYDLIVARESLTYEALKEINKKTVLFPDPAFSLPIGKGNWPNGLKEKPYIGINLSPMVESKEQKSGITLENYKYLIQKILEETEFNIALIPHVVKRGNDDRVVLQRLYNETDKKKRLFIIEDQNCLQLKDIISKCVCFIGARTHATIAAYSTGVPTLVIGYSIKARGIAKDLFGTSEHYVLPVQTLANRKDLYMAYRWIMKHQNEIKNRLKTYMPEYKKKLCDVRKVIEKEIAF